MISIQFCYVRIMCLPELNNIRLHSLHLRLQSNNLSRLVLYLSLVVLLLLGKCCIMGCDEGLLLVLKEYFSSSMVLLQLCQLLQMVLRDVVLFLNCLVNKIVVIIFNDCFFLSQLLERRLLLIEAKLQDGDAVMTDMVLHIQESTTVIAVSSHHGALFVMLDQFFNG